MTQPDNAPDPQRPSWPSAPDEAADFDQQGANTSDADATVVTPAGDIAAARDWMSGQSTAESADSAQTGYDAGKAASYQPSEYRAQEADTSTSQRPALPYGSGTDPAIDATQVVGAVSGPAGYTSKPAYSDAPDYGDGSIPVAQQAPAGAQPSYAPSGQPTSYQSGQAEPGTFFAQPSQWQQPTLRPSRTRAGQNLGGAAVGLIILAVAIVGYLLLTKNLTPTTDSTVASLLQVGVAVILAVPALLAGWAPAAAWMPGLVLTVASLGAIFWHRFTGWMATFSQDIFNTPALPNFLASWGLVAGLLLLFAGFGAQAGRRGATIAALDRIAT